MKSAAVVSRVFTLCSVCETRYSDGPICGQCCSSYPADTTQTELVAVSSIDLLMESDSVRAEAMGYESPPSYSCDRERLTVEISAVP